MKMRRGNALQVNHTTAFANWRRTVKLSQSEAATALGKSKQCIVIMERGATYNGTPARIPKDTLMLMGAIAKGYDLTPWPTEHIP